MSKKPKGRKCQHPPRSRSHVMIRADFPVPTDIEIDAAMACPDAWMMARWGIPYPLPKGWRARLRSLSQAGHTRWLGWYFDQRAMAAKSVKTAPRGVMGMGT